MISRRSFFGAAAAAAAFALDPERALWIRGAKTISIPKPIFLGIDPASGIDVYYVHTFRMLPPARDGAIQWSLVKFEKLRNGDRFRILESDDHRNLRTFA